MVERPTVSTKSKVGAEMPIFDFPFKLINSPGGNPTNQTQVLDAAGEWVAMCFCAEATISVKKAGFRLSAATSTSSTSKVTVSVETINTSTGEPSGTAIVTQQVNSDTLAVGWNEITFSTAGTINAGTIYALKINADTGWVTTSISVVYAISAVSESFLPYTSTFANARVANRHNETFYLIDNAGTPKVYGWPLQTTTGYNLNSSLVEVGNKFRIPTTVCSTYKLLGIRYTGDPGATATPEVKIAVYDWNSGNNSTALDSTIMSPLASALLSGTCVFDMYFDDPPTLTAGSDYIAAIGTNDATSATVPMQVRTMGIDDDHKPALWDQTTNYIFDRVSRTSDTGSWTTTADEVCLLHLILDVASLPSGGSTAANPLAGYIL